MLRIKTVLIALISYLAISSSAVAQDSILDLAGSWEYRKNSMHVEFSKSNTEANVPVYEAKITRSDWSPMREGRTLYINVVQTGAKKWRGIEIDDKGKQRKVRFAFKRDGKLHTTSYLDGVKKIQWTSNQKITEGEVATSGI